MYIAQLNAPYSFTFETVAEVSVLVFGQYNWLRFDNYLKQHIHKFAHMQHGYVYLYQYMYDVQKFFVCSIFLTSYSCLWYHGYHWCDLSGVTCIYNGRSWWVMVTITKIKKVGFYCRVTVMEVVTVIALLLEGASDVGGR